MKRVYTTESVALAWHMRNVLEQHHIDAVVKNEQLYSIAGEMPITECLAEVWVKHDLDFRHAENIIRDIESTTEVEGEDWSCDECGETNMGNFAVCWNCQRSHDQETVE